MDLIKAVFVVVNGGGKVFSIDVENCILEEQTVRLVTETQLHIGLTWNKVYVGKCQCCDLAEFLGTF